MIVDDHAVNSLRTWFDIAYEDLKKEWRSNEYGRLSDCPSFKLAHTYHEALNVLIKGPKHFEETELKRMLAEELETEKHWENK